MSRINKLSFPSIILFIALCACNTVQPTEDQPGLPNPASVFCEESGGYIEIRADSEGGQYGTCVFIDGSECEEWAYFRGECQPGQQMIAPSPVSVPRYINDFYGFSINPPEEWSIEGYEDYLVLSRPGYTIFIGFQWANDQPKPFRTGMPQGDLIDDGTAKLLGQSIPKRILVWEGKNRVVDYGGRIKAGDLKLVFYLDGVETDDVAYEDIDIPTKVIAEADSIIASFTLNSGETPTLELNP